MPDESRAGTSAAKEMRRTADAVASETDETGERSPEQGPPRATPGPAQAERATADRTPSGEAGQAARAEFARRQEESDGAGDAGAADPPRTAKQIVADEAEG